MLLFPLHGWNKNFTVYSLASHLVSRSWLAIGGVDTLMESSGEDDGLVIDCSIIVPNSRLELGLDVGIATNATGQITQRTR